MFQSYLSERFQFVCANKVASTKQRVMCKVPQGSILGPTLFSLYVNDLPKFTKFSVRLFADDTVLILNDKNLDKLNNKANTEVQIIDEWLRTNKLTLNQSKTCYMLFSPKQTIDDRFSLYIRGKKSTELLLQNT